MACDALERTGEWRNRHHLVAEMPMERVASYLRFDPSSNLALIDAIVCDANTPLMTMTSGWDINGVEWNYPLERALLLADDVRGLPEQCAMRDGRKWRSIPFIIFPSVQFEMVEWVRDKTHATILPYIANRHWLVGLRLVEQTVNEYQDRVLADYVSVGILIRFVHGHVQVLPALKKKHPNIQSEYYYSPTDRRKRRWITVRRDHHGLRHDIELFQELIDSNAGEHRIQEFFEQHPALLMQARNAVPIPHKPNFAQPANNKPDFAFSPILGPVHDTSVELLEVKLPGEKTLNNGLHRGLAAKVHRAIDQVKDYARCLNNPANFERILRDFGYLPHSSKLAVLIGRNPKNEADKEVWLQRQSEIDVTIITYDEILQTQANQLGFLS